MKVRTLGEIKAIARSIDKALGTSFKGAFTQMYIDLYGISGNTDFKDAVKILNINGYPYFADHAEKVLNEMFNYINRR